MFVAGTLERFVNVMSARTVVGNNKDGQLLILQVDGRTDHRGYIYQMSVYGRLGGVGQGNFPPNLQEYYTLS